jgi:hypothetical protein
MGFALALLAILAQLGPGPMDAGGEASIEPDDPPETVEVGEQEDHTEEMDPELEGAEVVEEDEQESLEEKLQQDSGTVTFFEDDLRGPEVNRGSVKRPGRSSPGASGRRPGSRGPPKGGPRGQPVRRKPR